MIQAIHHWPIRKNVTVVAAVTALPKGMIIPRMEKEVLSIGLCKEINDEKFKGPPWRAFPTGSNVAVQPPVPMTAGRNDSRIADTSTFSASPIPF